jgi:hypothetical protein
MNAPTMRGHLRHCWIFTWRTPIGAAQPHLPAPLELVTHGGFAFWNVVVCEVRGLRPAPLPPIVGLGYWHVAYRLHTRVRVESGETIEGLYFVRSDSDRLIVSTAGNWLTDFRFRTARIAVAKEDGIVEGEIRSRDAKARFRLREGTPGSLSPGSPFASVGEAGDFLKYKPFALSPVGKDSVSIVRVVRNEADWRSRIVTVEESNWQFFAGREVAPEVCYAVEPIDYEWRRAEVRRVAR